ncbi:MAG: glycoside hydrolase family 1 protein [Propionicimonas sp.]
MPAFSLPRCVLGVATAATQIEGGELDTNWHRWAAAGRIADGSSPARAADHWNRVTEDVALLKELGIRHYRMGLEWARLEPDDGNFDPEAFAHYRDELTSLHDAGITTLVTLHHFTLPGWFVDSGGWLAADAVPTFLRFVEKVVTELGDLGAEWITINEPNIYATQAYLFGTWPPGQRSFPRSIAVMRALAGAHIAAYVRIHELQPHARVAAAHHLRVFAPAQRRNPAHRAGAVLTRYLFQGALVKAFNTGRSAWPLRAPKGVRPGRYFDFHAINYYSRSTVRGIGDGVAAGADVNDLGWEIYPAGLVEVASWMSVHYPGVPVFLTENGTCDTTDSFRSRFLYDHLAGIAASDLPIERYYHWCFTDNWEWAEGEAARFGLVQLDFATQHRAVKDSGRFYADIIANGGVTEAAHERWVAGQKYPTNAAVQP